MLREAGLTFEEIGARLEVTRERARQLHVAAAGVVTDAARRGALLTRHVVVPHARPSACTTERCRVPMEMSGTLDLSIEALALNVRGVNCLACDGIYYVDDLVRKTEAELLRIPSLGRQTLCEIRDVLGELGLHLGMDVGDKEQAEGTGTVTEPVP